MKKFIILLTLIAAFPLVASAYTSASDAEKGNIYSLNVYGHFGSHEGLGADLGGTFHLMPDYDISPIVFFGVGCGGLDHENFYIDMKLLGGVAWHATDFFYMDIAAGAQGFFQLGTESQLGGAFVADANILLHLAEIIGIRAGCMVSIGTNGAMISPHVGLASMFDFSWLF